MPSKFLFSFAPLEKLPFSTDTFLAGWKCFLSFYLFVFFSLKENKRLHFRDGFTFLPSVRWFWRAILNGKNLFKNVHKNKMDLGRPFLANCLIFSCEKQNKLPILFWLILSALKLKTFNGRSMSSNYKFVFEFLITITILLAITWLD